MLLLNSALTSLMRICILTGPLTLCLSLAFAKQAVDRQVQFAKDVQKVAIVPPNSKPPMTQESIDIALILFDIQIPKTAEHPSFDASLEDRGLTTLPGWGKKLLVTIGPAAFTSWALLGSTLAHELEIHCQQNFAMIRMKDLMGLNGTMQAEREAYQHELAQAARFHLLTADQLNIKATMDYYYPASQQEDQLTARKYE